MSEIEYDEELHKKFFELVGSPEEGKKINQSKAALAMGYSSGVISAYKSRTYAGNVKLVEEKIREYLGREARRLTLVEIPTAETSIMETVRRAITVAQDEADIAVIIGESGCGKTTALRQYVKESFSALLVEVDPSFSQVILMQEIARVLGVEPKGATSAIIERVIDALRDRDAVLIIDEADYLSDASLELLRRVIHDKGKTGVALCGLPRLEYKIRNLKNDHQQLQSRIGVFAKLGKLKKGDAEKIIGGVWKGLSQDIVDAFTKTAGGSARTLVKLIGRVHQLMGINRVEAPNAEIITEAGELLMR